MSVETLPRATVEIYLNDPSENTAAAERAASDTPPYPSTSYTCCNDLKECCSSVFHRLVICWNKMLAQCGCPAHPES